MHQLITTSRLSSFLLHTSQPSPESNLLFLNVFRRLHASIALLIFTFFYHCSNYFFPFSCFTASKGKALKEEWISYICHEVLNVSVPLYVTSLMFNFLETCYTQFFFLFFILGRVWVIFIKIMSYIEISRDRMCCWLMGQKLSLVRTSETVS